MRKSTRTIFEVEGVRLVLQEAQLRVRANTLVGKSLVDGVEAPIQADSLTEVGL
jgi:hypothetical protein